MEAALKKAVFSFFQCSNVCPLTFPVYYPHTQTKSHSTTIPQDRHYCTQNNENRSKIKGIRSYIKNPKA
jgi:hypothetical protein